MRKDGRSRKSERWCWNVAAALRLALALQILSGCTEPVDVETTDGQSESAIFSTPDNDYLYSQNLDAIKRGQSSSTYHEIDMYGGRLSKLPVEAVWYGRKYVATAAARWTHYRAYCPCDVSGQTNLNCDPVIFLKHVVCGLQSCLTPTVTIVRNNDAATGFGSTTTNAQVTTSCPANSWCYDYITVPNRTAGQAVVTVEWQITTTSTPSFTTPSSIFDTPTPPLAGFDTYTANGLKQTTGGAIIRVGALQGAHFFEVATPNNGNDANTRTNLWLYGMSTGQYLDDLGQSCLCCGQCEYDPKVSLAASSNWANPDNYLVVGKAFGPRVLSPSRADNQTLVELLHGPFYTYPGYEVRDGFGTDCIGYENSRATCTGDVTATAVAGAGRWTFSVYANTDNETYGRFAADDPALWSNMWDSGFGALNAPDRPPSWNRGHANNLAFSMKIERASAAGGPWTTIVAERHVPRALLGCRGGDYCKIGLDVDMIAPYFYRLVIWNNGVKIRALADQSRNLDSVEFKVAHLNHEYDFGAPIEPSIRNAVDLLYASGSDVKSTGFSGQNNYRVTYEPSRVFEWGADYAQLQEVRYANESLETHWAIHQGIGAEESQRYTGSSYGTWSKSKEDSYSDDRTAVALLNDWVSSDGNSEFTDSSLTSGGCQAAYPDPSIYERKACPIFFKGGIFAPEEEWHSMPVKLKIRKQNAGEKRVVLFNTYSVDDDGSERYSSVVDLVDHIKRLMAATSDSTSPDFTAFGGDGTPLHPDNRLIIMGDVNFDNHAFSEINHTLRYLQEQFGYAVDVSMVQLDRDNRTMDMHYSGAPINSFYYLSNTYKACNLPGISANEPSEKACTDSYKTRDIWWSETTTKYNIGPTQTYPWWAAPSGKGHSGRRDVILLVGRGWRNDDPVVKYMVMSDRSTTSYANGYNSAGGGVEMVFPDKAGFSPCGVSDEVTAGTFGYTPRMDAGCGATSGSPAIRSDHKPIGARLRIR